MNIQIPAAKDNQQVVVIATKEADEVFVFALRSGCPVAFMSLYKLYAPALKGIIFGIVKSDAIAEKVLTEIFVKIRYSINHYQRSKGRLFTWMAALARNAAVDHLSINTIQKSDKIDGMEVICLKGTANFPVSLLNGAPLAIKKSGNVISSCPNDIFKLVYVEGHAMAQVAEELGITMESAKKQFRIAVQKLKTNFQVVPNRIIA